MEGGTGDLLLSGDLMRVAEEEDRRLLMPASGGCFRFMVDVERLSTRREEERQTREAGFTLEVSQNGMGIWVQTREFKVLQDLSTMQWVICCAIDVPKINIHKNYIRTLIYCNIPINLLI